MNDDKPARPLKPAKNSNPSRAKTKAAGPAPAAQSAPPAAAPVPAAGPIVRTSPTERDAKIRRLKTKLDEIKQYKKILAEEGLFPDENDKARESELIIQLLRLEKGLDAKIPPPHKRQKLKKALEKKLKAAKEKQI